MTDRLSALDVSFLFLEGPTTPMHLGNLAVFELPSDGLDYEGLVALIEDRIAQTPRYRQKVVWVPGNLAYPVWVDDATFDVAYHVRRSGLPRPGTDAQLLEFCARIQSRPLDRRRPLWEMYLIEGLAGDRVAIATKTHYAMVDGITAIDLEQVLLDPEPTEPAPAAPLWMPRPGPDPTALVLGAIAEIAHRPTAVLDAMRLGVSDLRTSARRALSTINTMVSAANTVVSAARTIMTPPPSSPLNATVGERRRFSVVRTDLEDFRLVHGAQSVTVNDVVLAVVAGALRGWLLSRGEAVHQSTSVRVMVPVSVAADGEPAGSAGVDGAPASSTGPVSPMFVDLPVGEPNPIVRLTQISYAMRANAEAAATVGAKALTALGGFAPPTLHALAARLGGGQSRRLYNLVVTNVPGPQVPLYAASAKMIEIFPIVPLMAGQALAIGTTSYDGGIFFGLNGDRETMADIEVIARLIEASLAELVAASDLTGSTGSRIATVTDVRGRRPSTSKRATGSARAEAGRSEAGRPEAGATAGRVVRTPKASPQ